MLLTPLAALPVCVVAAASGWAAEQVGLPAIAGGGIAVGALAYGTRAMHLDGLADTVDGLGGGWTRERSLEIMRRGDIGPMGAAALIVTLLVQAGVIGGLAATWQGAAATTLVLASSRGATAICAARPVPPARPDGLGAAVARSVPTWAAIGAIAVSALILTVATTLWHNGAGHPLPWWSGGAAVLCAAAATIVVVRRACRRLGGVTGDVIGAAIEISALVGLVVLDSCTLPGGLR